MDDTPNRTSFSLSPSGGERAGVRGRLLSSIPLTSRYIRLRHFLTKVPSRRKRMRSPRQTMEFPAKAMSQTIAWRRSLIGASHPEGATGEDWDLASLVSRSKADPILAMNDRMNSVIAMDVGLANTQSSGQRVALLRMLKK